MEASAAEANAALIRLLPSPSAAGPGYRVGGFLDPCLSGSGDFFDVFSAGESEIAFYGFDVMGHGILASIMAFSLRDLLPVLGWGRGDKAPTPAEIVRSLYERYGTRSDSAWGARSSRSPTERSRRRRGTTAWLGRATRPSCTSK